jgi:AAA family ATPase
LRAGDPCNIWIQDSSKHIAIAWPAPEKIQETILQTSKTLQNTYGFRLGDKISLARRDDPIVSSTLVFLKDLEPDAGLQESPAIHGCPAFDATDNAGWEWFLNYPLGTYLAYTSFKLPLLISHGATILY